MCLTFLPMQLSEADVAKALLPSCLVSLCRQQATAALTWIAAALQLPLYALLSNHADKVLAALMWLEPAGGYNAWQAWAERELLGADVEDGVAAVVQVRRSAQGSVVEHPVLHRNTYRTVI